MLQRGDMCVVNDNTQVVVVGGCLWPWDEELHWGPGVTALGPSGSGHCGPTGTAHLSLATLPPQAADE